MLARYHVVLAIASTCERTHNRTRTSLAVLMAVPDHNGPRAGPVPGPEPSPSQESNPGEVQGAADPGGSAAPGTGTGAASSGPASSGPTVVAVLVTEGTSTHLDACLRGLAGQDYPSLTVLVLDRGEPADREVRRERIGAIAPGVLVRGLDGAPPAVEAANDVLATVEGATFLCFVADDVELEPPTVSHLVAEAYRSNAAICGPKVVNRRHPEVLLEVGLGVDHYGVPYTGIEPGEVDQEQHDAVRDVFFVSDATMLVRADLFTMLGGFDPGCAPGSHDLDLCWRARLAGARVLVVPDARVLRGAEAARRPDTRAATVGDAARARARTLLKVYSAPALVWVVPVATLLNLGEAVGYLATRRARQARMVVAGWWRGLAGLTSVRGLRRATQQSRRIDDRDVRSYMVRGSARARALLIRRRHHNARLAITAGRARGAVGGVRAALRTPDAILGLAFAVLLAFGARRFLSHAPSFAGLSEWPSLGDLLGAWGGRWRFAGLGSDAAAPASLGVFGAASAVLFGDTDLARALFAFAAAPVGALGVYRLTRPLAARALPAVTATIAYAANPIVRNAYARGALGPLVLVALAPFIARRCFTLAEGIADPSARRRALAGLVVLSAITSSVFPAAVLLPLVITVALAVASPLVGGARLAGRASLAALVAGLGAVILLWPWSGSLVGAEASTLGFVTRAQHPPADLLAFRTGPAGAGTLPYLLLAAAALPLIVATGARFAWAVRGWMLMVVSFALAYLPSRVAADLPVPAVEGVLVPAALGLALAVGIGIGAFIAELRTFVFGVRQGLAVVCAACAVAPFVGFVPDVFDGGYRAPDTTWGDALAFLTRQANGDESFRLLWVGDPEVLPVDAIPLHGPLHGPLRGSAEPGELGFALTRDGVGDVRDLLPASPGAGDGLLEESLVLARSGRTARLGHLLAPMSVRYVAIVDRSAPNSRVRAAPDPRLVDALTSQLDLTVARRTEGLVLYENEAWAPRRALADGAAAALAVDEAGRDDPIAAATRAELATAIPVRGALGNSDVERRGTLLFSERYAEGWRAVLDGQVLEHRKSFGWANAYEIPDGGTVSLRYDAGGLHAFRVVVPAVLWVAALALSLFGRRATRVARSLVLESEIPASQRLVHDDSAPAATSAEIPVRETQVPQPLVAEGDDAEAEDLAALDALAASPADDTGFDWSILGRDEGDAG